MPLSQDVSNTQTGSKVNSIPQTNQNIRSRASVSQASQPQSVQKQEQAPTKDAKWQELYGFMTTSDAVGTDLSYEDFVNKYSTDESSLRKLYTGVQLNTDFNSPFKSKSWNEFKSTEFNDYFGAGSKQDSRSESEAVTIDPVQEVVDQSSNAVASKAFETANMGSLTGQQMQQPEEVLFSRQEGLPAVAQKPQTRKQMSFADLYKMTTPESKKAAFDDFNDFVAGSNINSVKNPDVDNILINYDNKDVFGTPVVNPDLRKYAEKGTVASDELFDQKLSSYMGVPLDVVQQKKGEWALQSKMAGMYSESNDEDFLTDSEIAIRDRYAEQQIVKEGRTIKDEYHQKASIASGGYPHVYWTQFSKSIESGFLTQQDLEIKKHLDNIKMLESKPNKTIDDQLSLKKSSDLVEYLRGKSLGEELFNEDGTFVSNRKIKFNRPDEVADKVDKYSALYENTDVGALKSKRDDAFFQYVYAKRKYDEAVKLYESLEGTYSAPKSAGETGFENAEEAKKSMLNYEQFMEDRFANFYSINRMILLNSDPGTVGQDSFVTGIAEGFKEATNIVSSSVGAMSDRGITALSEMGYELTDEQKNKIESGFWEGAGRAVGNSIPISVEIGFNIWLGNKALGVAGIPRLAQAIAGSNKYARFVTNMALDSFVQGAAFEATGESWVGGAGEGVGQSIASSLARKFGLGEASTFITKWLTGSTTETIAELSGQIVDSWESNGLDWKAASKEVFGETPEDAASIVATTFIVAMTLGVGGSAQDSHWMDLDQKQNDVWSVFLKEAQDFVNKSDSKSPIVEAVKEIDINTPPTKEEVAKKEDVIEKKNSGKELTEDEVTESQIIATKEDFSKSKAGSEVEIEFDVAGIEPVKTEDQTTKTIEPSPKTEAKKKAPVKKDEKKPAITPTSKLTTGSTYSYNGKELTVTNVVYREDGTVKSVSAIDGNSNNFSIVNTFKSQESFDRLFTGITKPKKDDKKDISGVSGEEQVGEKPVTAKPIEKESVKAPEASRVVQAPEVKIESTIPVPEKPIKKKQTKAVSETRKEQIEEIKKEKDAGVTRTEGASKRRGKKQDITGVEPEKSSDKEVRTVIDKGGESKSEPKKQKQLTKEQTVALDELSASQIESLKEKLGVKSKSKSGKAVQREFSKAGGDVNALVSAIEEVQSEGVVDYAKKRTEFDAVFNKAEDARKAGNVDEAVALYNQAKEIMPDQSERVDTAIDVAKSSVVNAAEIKTEEEIAAEEAVKTEEESVKKLDSVRSSIVDSEATAISTNKAGKKRSVTGSVLSVNRTSTEGEYEVLIDNGDNKSATKAIYNESSGEYTIVPQEKSEQIKNKSNFDASKSRKDIIGRANKSKKQDEVLADLVDDVLEKSDEVGSAVAVDKKRGKTSIKKSFNSLLSKIAYANIENVSDQYILDLKSELNGLISDKADLADIKVKKKIQNMIDSLIKKKEKKEDVVSEEEVDKEAEKAAKALEDKQKKESAKEKKKAPSKKKEKNTVGLTGIKSIDSKISKYVERLDAIFNSDSIEDVNLKEDMLPIFNEAKAEFEPGSNEWGAFMEKYQTVQRKINEAKNRKLAGDEKAILKALKAGSKSTDFDESDGFDDNYQTKDPEGRTKSSGVRVSARTVTESSHKKKMLSISEKIKSFVFGKNAPTRKELVNKLAETVQTKVFEYDRKVTKKVTKDVDGEKVEVIVDVKPKWLGRFRKSQNYIQLRGRNDIDVTIHEIGHAVSYRFDFKEAVVFGAYDAELSKLWIFGSEPKSKMNKEQKLEYRREEGIAEFIRAYSINPKLATELYPNLTALYEQKVSKDVKSAIEEFGAYYSSVDSMTDMELMDMIYNNNEYVENYLKQEGRFQRFNKVARLVIKNAKKPTVKSRGGRITMGWWTLFHTSVVEKTGALRATVRFIEKKLGKDFIDSKNPYKLIRLMSNFSQNRFRSLTSKGLVDKFGERVVNERTGKFMNFNWLFEPMGDAVDKIGDITGKYLIAKNIVASYAAGKKDVVGQVTGTRMTIDVANGIIAEVESYKESNPELHDAVIESAKRWQEMALQTVKYRYETGLISKERYDEIASGQDNYAALFRDLDEFTTGTDIVRRKQKTFRRSQKLEKAEGSEAKIENLYVSMTELIMEAYYEGDKNVAMSSFVEALSGIEGEVYTEDPGGDTKEIQYFKDGEFKKAYVSQDVAYVLDAVNAPVGTGVPQIDAFIGFVREWLIGIPKRFITSTPAFLFKNLSRDTLTRILSSRYGIKASGKLTSSFITEPTKDVVDYGIKRRGLANELKNLKSLDNPSPEHKERMDYLDEKILELDKKISNSASELLDLYGGSMAGYQQRTQKEHYQTYDDLKKIYEKDNTSVLASLGGKLMRPKSWYKAPASLIKTYKEVFTKAENINRIIEFKKVYDIEYNRYYDTFIKEGYSDTDADLNAKHNARIAAAFEAKDLMDFTVSGTSMGIINSIMMFLNPNIQGWNRTVKTFVEAKGENRKKAAAAVTARLVLFSAMATAAEVAWSYYNDDEDDLTSMPSYQQDTFWTFKLGDNSYFRIPKPFEFGMVSSAMTRGIHSAMGYDDAWAGFDETLWNSLPKVLTSPQSILGFGDSPITAALFSNRDEFFDKNIIPEYERGLKMDLRNTKYSSEFSKSSFLTETLGLDPRQTDFIIKKSFSDFGEVFLGMWDAAVTDKTVEDAFKKKHIGLLVETPYKNSDEYKNLTDMMELYGIRSNNKQLDSLKEIEAKYEGSTSNSDKEKYADQYRKEAKRVVTEWKSIVDRDENLYSVGGVGTDTQKEERKMNESSKTGSRKNKRMNKR